MRGLVVRLLALCVAFALVGCDSATHPNTTARPHVPAVTISPRYVPAPQTGWMHGVGVDVPASWPRNQLRCGQPWRTTLVVEPAGAAVPLCFWLTPKNLHPDVVWVGGYLPQFPNALLGPVSPPPGGFAAMTPVTIAGEPAREWNSRDPRTHQPVVLVVLPRRQVYVAAMSMHRAIRAAAIASIRIVATDPATGCATHTTAYDAPPRHPVLDRPIDVSSAVAVTACHYVAGWLEATAVSTPPAKLRALVDAIDRAPHVTTARAPVDDGCQSLIAGPPQYTDDGPVVLRFRLRDGGNTVVVARIVACTRWQSYLYAGNIERRMTGAFLLALPPVLLEFPGPETM